MSLGENAILCELEHSKAFFGINFHCFEGEKLFFWN